MPTTPGGLPYPAPTEPVSQGAAAIQALALAIDPRLTPVTLSPTPPASPVDGQLWALSASDSGGVVWVFRYRASPSSYKWEFVGGAPYSAVLAASQTLGAANTWTNLGASTLPLPRAGEYLISAYCAVAIPAAGVASPYLAVYANTPGNTLAAVNATGNATWALSLAIVNARPAAQSAGAAVGLSGFGPVGTSYGAGASWSITPIRIL
jgi:hypothetical protein